MAHLSRTPKIEDVSAEDASSSRDTGSILSQLLSITALSHAVSGSVGGNVAMLGQYLRGYPAQAYSPPCFVSIFCCSALRFSQSIVW